MKKSDMKPTEIKAPVDTIQNAKSVVASEAPRKDLCCDEDHNHPILEEVESIEKSEGDGTPDIIKTLVYYGLGEGKKPDPNRILYYERPDGSCIDVNGGMVLPTRPSVLDHLPSRAITTDERDIVSAIINGAMSDSDFASLSEHGMIGDLPTRLWEKTQLLKSQNAALAKAQELTKSDSSDDDENKSEDEPEESEAESEESDSESKDESEDNSDSEPEESSDDEMSDDLKAVKEDVGDDVFQEIMDLAMAKAINAVGGGSDGSEGLEGKIRSIVQDVLEKMFGDEDPGEEQSTEPESESEESEDTSEEAE